MRRSEAGQVGRGNERDAPARRRAIGRGIIVRLTVAGLLGSVFATAGCGKLLGLEDTSVGSAGSAGQGGQAGAGGVGGAGNSAGGTGAAGESGFAGSGGNTTEECSMLLGPLVDGCDFCLQAECSQACNEFVGLSHAEEFLSCIQSCGFFDRACVQTCSRKYPKAGESFQPLRECLFVRCIPHCQMEMDGICVVLDLTNSCDKCVDKHCGSECVDCTHNKECMAFVACAMNCPPRDSDCEKMCLGTHAEGLMDALDLLDGSQGCIRANCPDLCGTF